MTQVIPTEHPDYPGYFHIPGHTYGLISKEGKVIGTIEWEELAPHPNHKGYLLVNFVLNDGRRSGRTIHRLLGLTFIPIPEKYKDVPIDELEVNHINGNKTDNSLTNLEWNLTFENVRHAHKFIGHANSKRILARDVRNNIITSFNSTAECARHFNMERKTLYKHLISSEAGTKTISWNVFKYDDNSPWPDADILRDSWYFDKILLGKELTSERLVIFNDIEDAASMIGVNLDDMISFRQQNGTDIPYNGWIIKYVNTPKDGKITESLFSSGTARREKSIRLTNLLTNEETEYQQVFSMLSDLGLSQNTFNRAIKNNNGVWRHYKFDFI